MVAGEVSQGFVLIVPSKVMDFESSTNEIHRHWSDLRAIVVGTPGAGKRRFGMAPC